MTSFEADLGWQPRSPLDSFQNQNEDVIQSVKDFKNHLQESFQSATFAYRLAQARQSVYNAKRYQPPSYKIDDEVYLSEKLFSDAASASRPPQQLTIRRVGSFTVTELIGKNAIRLSLPDYNKIHPMELVEHTSHDFHQPQDIGTPLPTLAQPFTNEHGETLIEVSRSLFHWRRGKGYQFLTQFKDTPEHEAECLPFRDFLDDENTITEALHKYITENTILQHLH